MKRGNFILLSYRLNELKQSEKMKLIRGLFGYSNRKEGKIYFSRGILDDVGGKRVGINSVIVPAECFGDVRKFFSEFGTKLDIMVVVVKK
jgi:hypothetical protein